jgi:hypothetical protein
VEGSVTDDVAVPAVPADASRRHRLRWSDLATMLAVICVVAITSLPRLADFARRENEDDARRLCASAAQALHARANQSPPNMGALFAATPELTRQFRDARVFEDGRVVRNHGYWFELLDPDAGAVLRAWPARFARTGFTAFVALANGTVLAHDNERGQWSAERPPEPPTGNAGEVAELGWRR